MKNKAKQMSLKDAKALIRAELLLIHEDREEMHVVDSELKTCKSIQQVCNAMGDFGFDFEDAVDFILCTLVKKG